MRVLLPTLCVLVPALAAASPPWPALGEPPARTGGGERDAALVIGVADYPILKQPIPGADANARELYLWLTETRGVPVENAVLLLNAQAVREEILARAKEVAGRVGRGGTLWIVFIGHGAPAADGKDGVLIGADAQQTPRLLYARSVAQKELREAVSEGRARERVLILDSCFSGKTGDATAIAPGLQPTLLADRKAMAPRGFTVLTAGTSSEFAGPLPGLSRPAFSYLFLGAVRGWGDTNGDGRITAKEARDYARRALQALSGVTGRTQTPELIGNADTMLAANAREAGPSLARVVASQGTASPTPVAEDWQPASAGKRHIVRFESTPAGSVVMVDDRVVCQATPCSVDVVAGSRRVELQKPHYQPHAETVSVQGPRTVAVALVPTFATLDVGSTPPGLSVSVNGAEVGKTPLAGHRLAPGTHTVEVSDRCHYPERQQVQLAAGKSTRVTLAPKTRPAAVDVTAKDERGDVVAAQVHVDGQRVGTAPGVFRVPVCARTLELRSANYDPYRESLTLREKATHRVSARLRSEARDSAVVFERIELPGTGTELMGKAIAAFNRGDVDESIRLYKAAVTTSPRLKEAWYNLAIAFGRKGQYTKEILAYERAIAIDPRYAKAVYNLAVTLEDAGDAAGAERNYQRVIELEPGKADARINLGILRSKHGRHEEAIRTYRTILQGQPSAMDAAEAWYHIGLVHDKRAKSAVGSAAQPFRDQAIAAYRKALTFNPKAHKAWYNIAVQYDAMKRPKDERDALHKAVEAKPDYPNALWNLAVAYDRVGDVSAAIRWYERYVEVAQHLAAEQKFVRMARKELRELRQKNTRSEDSFDIR